MRLSGLCANLSRLCAATVSAILGRRNADDAPKVLGHMALVSEADSPRKLGERQRACRQKLPYALNAPLDDVLVGRGTRRRPEQSAEVEGAERRNSREHLYTKTLVEVGLDILLHPSDRRR
jgi:hypothetical protein